MPGEVTPASVTGSEERGVIDGGDDRLVPAVGERERESSVGSSRGRLGRLASRVRPSWAPGLFLLFFSSANLFFCCEILFGVLKRFFYSDFE
jgi:hypothetical protein